MTNNKLTTATFLIVASLFSIMRLSFVASSVQAGTIDNGYEEKAIESKVRGLQQYFLQSFLCAFW